jgi:hypothetical protein
MTRRVLWLDVVKDDDGNVGLVPGKGTAREGLSASLDGRFTAHDLLEHGGTLDNIGPVASELEALGAAWYLRGQHGRLTAKGDEGRSREYLARDVGQMLAEIARGARDMPAPLPHKPIPILDDDFRAIASEGLQFGLDEARYEDFDVSPADSGAYYEATVAYMRRGYLKARRRFPDAGLGCEIFWQVCEAVDGLLRARTTRRGWLESSGLEPGERFRLEYDTDGNGALLTSRDDRW